MNLHPVSLAVAASLLTSTSIWAETKEQYDNNQNTESMTVTAQKVSRYTAVDAPSTLRSDVPLLDTARSVGVINRDLLDDTDVQTIEEAVRLTSGTAPRHRMGGADSQNFVRGFRLGYYFRNGKREYSESRTSMDTVETVEVLKGPAAVQFGVNSPGGIINYTTKKPQAETMRSFKVRLDEYGKKEFVADVTGAANDSSSVLYRLIAVGKDSKTYRDFSDSSGYLIAPSLTFQLTDKTKLTTALELSHDKSHLDRGVLVGDYKDGSQRIIDVPKERVIHEDGDSYVSDKQYLDVTLSHDFNLQWRTELSYSYQNWENSWHETQWDDFFPEGGELNGVTLKPGDLTRGGYGHTKKDRESHQGSAMLFGDLELANTRHKLTLGADYGTVDFVSNWGKGKRQPSAEYPDIFNIYNPVYGEFNSNLEKGSKDRTEDTRTWGVFASDTVYIGDSLVANLALRYDDYYLKDSWDVLDDSAVVWNAGILYKLIPQASLYASYATSYEPNNSEGVVGEVKPSEGEQWEFGVKGLVFDESLQYSLVYYDITKSNIPNSIKENGINVIKYVGEQTSSGVELDTTWRANDDLTLLVNYAYTDAKISKDEDDPELVGKTPHGVPEHSAALFASYKLNPIVPNLSVLAGINYVGKAANKDNNKLFLPSYTRADLSLKYRIPVSKGDSFIVQAGVKNLTDEDIFISTGGGTVGVGAARTFYANLDYQF